MAGQRQSANAGVDAHPRIGEGPPPVEKKVTNEILYMFLVLSCQNPMCFQSILVALLSSDLSHVQSSLTMLVSGYTIGQHRTVESELRIGDG